jgi:hypothetical protein
MAGNTYEVVVLSSSPPAASPQHDAPSRRVAMLASSPLAFSPPASPLRPTTGASKSNTRAAPIPEGAVRGFATVGSLIRSEHFTSRLDDDFDAIQQAQSQRGPQDTTEPTPVAEKPKKRTTKKATTTTTTAPAAGDSEKPKPKPRARKAKPKSDKEILDSDDELRRPPQRPPKSPFFDDNATEPPVGPADEAASAPKLTKSGKPRKPRAKKQKAGEDGAEPVPKPKKPRVTKAKVGSGKGKQGDASVVSAHFQDGADGGDGSATRASVEDQDTHVKHPLIWDVPESPKPKKKAAPKQRQPDIIAEALELEEAVVRRRDWTPPPDTTIPSPFTDSTGKENKALSQNADGSFSNLLSNFAYAQSPSAQATTKSNNAATEAGAATKRRRIELVEIPSNNTNSRDSSPEKGKAPKKKPRTITDLVTEQYALKDAEPISNNPTSDFFESRTSTTTTRVPLNDASTADGDAASKKPVRRRNSSKSGTGKADPKPRSKKASTKATAKLKPVAEKLLSPSSAMSRLQEQDVLFGTSSQLALEESPTMLRQLQYALKESEQDVNTAAYGAPPRWPRLGRVESKRGLWAASARDDEGRVLEHLKDAYIPEPDRTQDIPLLMDGTHDIADDRTDDQSGFIDIDDIPPDPPPAIAISSDPPMPPPTASRATPVAKLRDDDRTKDMGFRDIDEFAQEPPPSGQKVASPDSFVDIDDFDFPPSAQVRKSPVSIFRPPASAPTIIDGSPKKRGRPPKSHSAVPASVPASSTPILRSTPPKPRAKSKTNTKTPSTPPTASGRFINIDEILDSEDEVLQLLSPTPPRRRKDIDSEPLPLITLSPTMSPSKANKAKTTAPDSTLTPIHRIATPLLEWSTVKTHVFSQITSHIRSLSPSTDPSKPTWHERILMYDPIVLEDFTAYLNAKTPIRVYKKATQKQIKAWNSELKSRGDEVVGLGVGVGREGDGSEVLAVEKELEGPMVQGWCESMSVCCIWGEGRGKKGTARKGFY